MTEAERMKKVWVQPAIYEVEREWTPKANGKYQHLREYLIERYIWRTEDMPSYRVALAENQNTPASHTPQIPGEVLQTRFLEYVPTGRIRYDNTQPMLKAVLFEYRLKDARDTRTNAERATGRSND